MPSRIPFVDLGILHTEIADELREAFERVVTSSGFVLGEEVERFEAEYAAYCGTRECVGVASGTAAITLALQAAGIGPGDEVIVPAHTYIASALGVRHAGAEPVFCDVDDATGLIDPGAAEAAVTERTAALLAVHLYGQVCDMPALHEVASRRALAVFEDAAQAHGATLDGARAGSFGAAAAFSFYPSKNLGALGDGGAICTDDALLAQRVRELRNIGQRGKGRHVVAGYNERLDGLQAAFLRAKLPHLDRWNRQRREHAAALQAQLGDAVGLLAQRPGAECVYHLFPVRVPDRDAVGAALAEAGVETAVHYSPCVPEQPPFVGEGVVRDLYPRAVAWAAEELSLPMFAGMTDIEISRVAEATRAAATPNRGVRLDHPAHASTLPQADAAPAPVHVKEDR